MHGKKNHKSKKRTGPKSFQEKYGTDKPAWQKKVWSMTKRTRKKRHKPKKIIKSGQKKKRTKGHGTEQR